MQYADYQILHRILCSSASLDVKNIARAAETCKDLRSFIYEVCPPSGRSFGFAVGCTSMTDVQNPDQALWRDVHLDRYDDPRASDASKEVEIDWKQRVQDREKVQAIFETWSEDRYDELVSHLSLSLHGMATSRRYETERQDEDLGEV